VGTVKAGKGQSYYARKQREFQGTVVVGKADSLRTGGLGGGRRYAEINRKKPGKNRILGGN